MSAEKIRDVEKMIAKVMRKKDLARNAAIDYMLVVATGRLAALWRYDESLPEGKLTKGILTLSGRKKRAPKTPKIVMPDLEAAPARKHKNKSKRARKPKAAKMIVESEAAE
jgi:hypothetical protein